MDYNTNYTLFKYNSTEEQNDIRITTRKFTPQQPKTNLSIKRFTYLDEN